MQNNALKDKHPLFYQCGEDLARLQNMLAKDRAAVWSIERGGYQVLTLQERLELSEAEKEEKLKAKAYFHAYAKGPGDPFYAYKQCQQRMCVAKSEDPLPISIPPPPGFALGSGLYCYCGVGYRNANVDCSPPHPDELDINAVISEFRMDGRNCNERERCPLNDDVNVAPSAKQGKFSADVTQKLLQTSYILFNILAEEVCFNDKLIKELCLCHVQSSKVKKRLSYTEQF